MQDTTAYMAVCDEEGKPDESQNTKKGKPAANRLQVKGTVFALTAG